MSEALTADSRSLADLAPHVRAMAEQLLADADKTGIPLTVTCTRRSAAEQTARYDQGRVTPGPIVTRAPAGYSYHEFGLALDVVPTELLSLKNWGDTPHQQARTSAIWAKVGAIGKALGFRWGGDFPHLVDRPHFEWGRVRQRGVISGAAPGCIDQAALGVICSGSTSSICGVARAIMPSICM